MIFNRLFGTASTKPAERSVYDLIVAQARQPWFYADLGVADTVSGRFDMIALHAFLVLERLGEGSEAEKTFSQALFDEMFRDMDRSLREMGVGDVSVGKRVRKMAEVFYGRAEAYRGAMAGPEAEVDRQLTQAIERNLFAGQPEPHGAGPLAQYMRQAAAALAGRPPADIAAGKLQFPATG